MDFLSGFADIDWAAYAPALAEGLLRTLGYALTSFAGALIVGLVVALLRISKNRLLRTVAAVYTELFKNVPLLAIIFITYFGLATAGIRMDAFQAGVVSLVIFYGAYLSETFRAALLGVHAGQQEAGQALGLSAPVTFADVVFPQALRLALPGIGTFFVDLLKSTSLLVVISAGELMSKGQLMASETFRALEVYIVISAIYFAVCYPLSQLMLMLENRVKRGAPLSLSRSRRLRKAQQLIAARGQQIPATTGGLS